LNVSKEANESLALKMCTIFSTQFRR